MDILTFTRQHTSHPEYGAYCNHLLKNLEFTSDLTPEVERMRVANAAGKVYSRSSVDQFFKDFKTQKSNCKQQ